MTMINEEIVRQYRTAKNPGKQIGILAELNATAPSAIRAILEAEGCELPQRGRPKTKEAPQPKAAETERAPEEIWDGAAILPAPEGAGDWPEPQADKAAWGELKETREMDVNAAAVEVIARMVADCDSSQDTVSAMIDFRERVRGVLALVYELRGGNDE